MTSAEVERAPDDIDEEGARQSVVDVEANIKLSQLRSSVEDIATQLNDRASTLERSLDIIFHMVNDRLNKILSALFAFELVFVGGIILIVGTLRHWF